MTELYCLTNFIDYSPAIHEPLKHSNRVKYTCFDISENYVIFGATSGSLYLFNRRAGKFLHLIPNKHGPISYLAISTNEKYVAFATQRSMICVYAINLSAQAAPQVIFTHLSSDQSVQVTCLHWTQDEKQFYYGDTRGQVNLVMLSSFIGNSLLNMTVHPLLFLDAAVVQIDDFESLLLVSNTTKCILCNTEYEEYKQIGNRPRDGAYGVCFAISNSENQQPSRIYCARPGTRIWEVDFDGEVIQTHQFKTALAIPPARIYKAHVDNAPTNDELEYEENDEMLEYQAQHLQFAKIQMLNQNFLLAYTEMALYVFDMRNSTVVLWCNQLERISDCRVVGEDIVVFTQTGSLYSVQLCSLQKHACTLVRQEKLLDCACLMRKNVKYFADKVTEDFDLHVLDRVKIFLINRLEYELLNDLSVIFDAIAQCEVNGDTNSSGGSSGTSEHYSINGTTMAQIHNHQPQQPQKFHEYREQTSHQASNRNLYVLENSFCDNLKLTNKGKENSHHFKDALLTVTGKFGKNIIKYKFNIFSEDQQKVVHDLIPVNERSVPFKDIKALYEPHGDNGQQNNQDDDDDQDDEPIVSDKGNNDDNDDEIVCRSRKRSSGRKFQKTQHLTAEEKTIYNLYLICKSAKISNTYFVERYRSMFDEYSARELTQLLSKLAQLMEKHGDSGIQAKLNCYEMYFNYLNPELIWEVDDSVRDYIAEGFIMLNLPTDIVRCDNCNFPLRFDNSCRFHALGSVLLRYYWSRNEQIKCFDVLNQVPALFDVLAKFYLSENNWEKVLPIVLNYGQPELLLQLGKSFNLGAWARCFERFVELQQGHLSCINCECTTSVDNVNRNFFYTWNCFLGIALEHLHAREILALILKWSNYMPHDAVDREFYTKCMLKG